MAVTDSTHGTTAAFQLIAVRVADPLVISDGQALVPDRPGHGIEPD
jgi:L-alanine-DL-glutamate epimerase-like enolase superfamily enzyme